MINEVLKVKNQLFEICKTHKVQSLYVFGSVVTDKFNVNSDIDFLYKFKDEVTLEQYSDNFFEFYEKLNKIFDHNIDLIGERNISNPFFKKVLEKTKVKIYEG
ncbi:MAG: nucleotidyltransferase domain-containing protein [Bacteroidota bacterium]|nr:nucleotidyltransferase domain-containing protein [Bacteroidota bacterium]